VCVRECFTFVSVVKLPHISLWACVNATATGKLVVLDVGEHDNSFVIGMHKRTKSWKDSL
jgi:hypothetical protein